MLSAAFQNNAILLSKRGELALLRLPVCFSMAERFRVQGSGSTSSKFNRNETWNEEH
jgi:hypothetical protein